MIFRHRKVVLQWGVSKDSENIPIVSDLGNASAEITFESQEGFWLTPKPFFFLMYE
jgi:hypothetical protein